MNIQLSSAPFGRREKQTSDQGEAAARGLGLSPLPTGGAAGVMPVNFGAAGFGGISGFDGVQPSEGRGWIYFPAVTAGEEVCSFTRWEADRRARWLYGNVGIAKRLVDALSLKVVGKGLRLKATTKDRDWNRMVEHRYARRMGSRQMFDASARMSGYDFQLAFQRTKTLRGDAFSLLMRNEIGMPQHMWYDPNQIRNYHSAGDARRWRDGVLVDDLRRAIAYRVVHPDGSGYRDYRARDMLHYMDHERPGSHRGVSKLIHAINHLLDVVETRALLKHGIKLGASIGYYLAASSGPPSSGGMGSFGRATTVEGETAQKINLGDVEGGGVIPDVGNREIKTLLDQRPHANGMAFEQALLRDVALGFGTHPEIMLDLGSLNNQVARLGLADLQTLVDWEQQALCREFCVRDYIWWLSIQIKDGFIPLPEDPEWWNHGYVMPKRVTLDIGRDGKLEISQYENQFTSLAELFGRQGQDWKEETLQIFDELEFKALEIRRRVRENPDLQESDFKIQKPGAPAPIDQPVPAEGDEGDE